MSWQCVDTIPIRVNASVAPARADAIRAALLRRAVPLSRIVDGRLEPLATAGLVADGRRTGLLTAAHIFERVSAGDLAIPLPRDRAVALLSAASVRVVMHAVSDLAVLWIDDALARRLAANWEACPLPQWQADEAAVATYVVAGYPSANVRRIDGWIYAKPVVLFTAQIDGACFAYARIAERTDGLLIHTRNSTACRARPSGECPKKATMASAACCDPPRFRSRSSTAAICAPSRWRMRSNC